jgi:hypothetical protein
LIDIKAGLIGGVEVATAWELLLATAIPIPGIIPGFSLSDVDPHDHRGGDFVIRSLARPGRKVASIPSIPSTISLPLPFVVVISIPFLLIGTIVVVFAFLGPLAFRASKLAGWLILTSVLLLASAALSNILYLTHYYATLHSQGT